MDGRQRESYFCSLLYWMRFERWFLSEGLISPWSRILSNVSPSRSRRSKAQP
jgi:hypothetical protein